MYDFKVSVQTWLDVIARLKRPLESGLETAVQLVACDEQKLHLSSNQTWTFSLPWERGFFFLSLQACDLVEI